MPDRVILKKDNSKYNSSLILAICQIIMQEIRAMNQGIAGERYSIYCRNHKIRKTH